MAQVPEQERGYLGYDVGLDLQAPQVPQSVKHSGKKAVEAVVVELQLGQLFLLGKSPQKQMFQPRVPADLQFSKRRQVLKSPRMDTLQRVVQQDQLVESGAPLKGGGEQVLHGRRHDDDFLGFPGNVPGHRRHVLIGAQDLGWRKTLASGRTVRVGQFGTQKQQHQHARPQSSLHVCLLRQNGTSVKWRPKEPRSISRYEDGELRKITACLEEMRCFSFGSKSIEKSTD